MWRSAKASMARHVEYQPDWHPSVRVEEEELTQACLLPCGRTEHSCAPGYWELWVGLSIIELQFVLAVAWGCSTG